MHVFSPDGSRLSFTYNDHVMHERDPARDLRNVGVAVPLHGVNPPKQHPREYDGSHYCVLVSETVPQPQPGSDQINRAYEEGWIGREGYRKADGSRQRWALAFIGDTLSASGEAAGGVYRRSAGERCRLRRGGRFAAAGDGKRAAGAAAGRQAAAGNLTGDRRYPGVAGAPRHWLRSSPDGSQIAFLMKDDGGVVQLWTVSPNGGEPRQVSRSEHDIQSAFSWHPQGGAIALVCDNSVMLCEVAGGRLQRLTQRSAQPPSADAVVFSPDGKKVAFMREIAGFNQIFVVEV